MARFKAVSELCNVVSLAAYCSDDSSMMMTLESVTSEMWLPSVKVQEGESWQFVINKELLEIFEVELESTKLLKIYKIWLPDHASNWIYHCVYSLNVPEDIKRKSKNTRGRYRGRVRWANEQELMKLWLNGSLRTPELITYFQNLRSHHEFPYTAPQEQIALAPEYTTKGKLVEISQDAFVNPGRNLYEQLIDAAGFTLDLQKYLYKEFIFFSFPAVYISQLSFIRFILELGWSREDAPRVFRAADITERLGLSYREYLFILAAIDPYTAHGGAPAEIRCRYMFRFFDSDKDGVLNLNEFRNFIVYMRKSKSLPPDLVEVMKDADAIYKNLGFSSITPLTIGAFLVAVGTLKIRGTSHIFRSIKSGQQYIQGILKREIRYKASETQLSRKPSEFGSRGKLEDKDYDLAVHTVRLQKSATLINVEELWNMQNAISQTALSILQTSTPEQYRRTSIAIFNQESECNELLKSLRYLQQLNKFKTYAKGKPLFSWGRLDSEVFGRHLINVCKNVQPILQKETRILELTSPIYIMGDLHGNISDLLYFEKVFWNLGPCLSPCNLLFLGDFVDRGAYGIETITYLFCYKMQTPQKVWLLRGNHEIRDIQRMFTFLTECTNKFGDKTGNEVWEAVNKVFDCMPLTAIIDEKIFCVHGGIPPPWLCPVVSAINHIPVPLDQPDVQSPLAWELMWNDPLKKNTMNDNIAMELSANDGFATNYRRGTAHIFSVEALERFLSTNNFSHIVRAHEVAQTGFNIQQKAKLLTVFSSSKYCGGSNEAACILADRGKLRVLRLETDT